MKRLLVVLLAGLMAVGMAAGPVAADDTDAGGKRVVSGPGNRYLVFPERRYRADGDRVVPGWKLLVLF